MKYEVINTRSIYIYVCVCVCVCPVRNPETVHRNTLEPEYSEMLSGTKFKTFLHLQVVIE